jgi:integrase
MNHLKRTRYQHGSLTMEMRKAGPAVWVYRWRETDANGRRSRPKVVIGTKADYPTKTSALKQLAVLGIDVNSEQPIKVVTLTLAKLVEHYRESELTENCRKTARTIEVYEQQIRQYILPKWGSAEIGQIKAVAVEAWLKSLPGAPATKAKTRNVMSSLYQHARRHEFITTNPISLVRQSSIRQKEPEVLSPEEVCALLEELDEPFRTIVYVVAVTGMRRGELFGLKWGDVDLQIGQLKIVRSIVDQKVGETKTRGSKGRMPLPNDAVVALRTWKDVTQYGKKDDWVFASPQALGEFPYWPNTVMVRHVQPAADRAGIGKRIGWHTFRHTLATLLQASGAGVKVTQELLRHSSPVMTLGTYAQAVTGDKRDAQDTVAAMFSKPHLVTSAA